jgi:hypothetical protein
MAAALNWVLEHHHEYNITTVNLSPVDDERHQDPLPTLIDGPLRALKEQGIWVSAPCGNNGYTDGISWPACQPDCFSIGATKPGAHAAHLDRFTNTDLLVAAAATSSSNANAAACSMILRRLSLAGSRPDLGRRHAGDLPTDRRQHRRSACVGHVSRTGSARCRGPRAGRLTFRLCDVVSFVASVYEYYREECYSPAALFPAMAK